MVGGGEFALQPISEAKGGTGQRSFELILKPKMTATSESHTGVTSGSHFVININGGPELR